MKPLCRSRLLSPPAQQAGFTAVELVVVIVILGLLAVSVSVRWPGGLDQRAASLEFKRALRYAQHKALTRQYTSAASAWGLTVAGNQYTVQRQNDASAAEEEYRNRALPGNATLAPAGAVLWFNGYGEPTDAAGLPLAAAVTYTVGGAHQLTVCPQTGYVLEGGSCP